MAITTTGIIVTEVGGQGMTYAFGESGQAASVKATGLTPNRNYRVSGYVVVDGGSTVTSINTENFSTLPAGIMSVSNVTHSWDTQTAQLTISGNWSMAYPYPIQFMNIRTSSLSDFSVYTDNNIVWTVDSEGGRGTFSATLDSDIPSGGGATYYVRLRAQDYYDLWLTALMTFTVPDQNLTLASTRTINGNNLTSTLATTPNPASYKIANNWISYKQANSGSVTDSPYATEMNPVTVKMKPDDYIVVHKAIDVYGKAFQSSSATVKMMNPYIDSYAISGQNVRFTLAFYAGMTVIESKITFTGSEFNRIDFSINWQDPSTWVATNLPSDDYVVVVTTKDNNYNLYISSEERLTIQ